MGGGRRAQLPWTPGGCGGRGEGRHWHSEWAVRLGGFKIRV